MEYRNLETSTTGQLFDSAILATKSYFISFSLLMLAVFLIYPLSKIEAQWNADTIKDFTILPAIISIASVGMRFVTDRDNSNSAAYGLGGGLGIIASACIVVLNAENIAQLGSNSTILFILHFAILLVLTAISKNIAFAVLNRRKKSSL